MPLLTSPPQKGVRILHIEVWRNIIVDWQNYVLGIDPIPPWFGLPGTTQVWFSDPESIFNCGQAADFGNRLALPLSTANGCIVVFFDPSGFNTGIPQVGDELVVQPLTKGGARQWVIYGNVQIDLSAGVMEAFEVGGADIRRGPL